MHEYMNMLPCCFAEKAPCQPEKEGNEKKTMRKDPRSKSVKEFPRLHARDPSISAQAKIFANLRHKTQGATVLSIVLRVEVPTIKLVHICKRLDRMMICTDYRRNFQSQLTLADNQCREIGFSDSRSQGI
jgi:hypothetical protein